MSRLTDDLDALARFTEAGAGVTRPAWSDALFEAYDWVAARAARLGMSSLLDEAGNLHLGWEVGRPPRTVVGSHLDTVPHGGRFDGALGVLGGLEAVRIVKRERLEPKHPISVIAFMDEEGTRFGTALFGSRAFVGQDVAAFADRFDEAGISLAQAMAERGFSVERLSQACRVSGVSTYLELHVEQGPVLDDGAADVGIVTSIVGLIGLHVRFMGEANHAGTTPMNRRRDALVGAARIIHELRDLSRSAPGITSNVGTISVEPGGKNVIPGRCDFTVDVRAALQEDFLRLEQQVRTLVGRVAAEEGLDADISELYRLDPVPMDASLRDLLERAADSAGANHMRLVSGAGHDAMALGQHTAAGMIFVPSRRGISHSPAEETSEAHCELGAHVLAHALKLLDREL